MTATRIKPQDIGATAAPATGVLARVPLFTDENSHDSAPAIRCKNVIPLVIAESITGITPKLLASAAATGLTGMVNLPAPQLVHSISYNVSTPAVGTGHVVRVAIFSESGILITGTNGTDAVGTNSGIRTITLGADVFLPAGNYRVFICSQTDSSVTNATISAFTAGSLFNSATDILTGTVVIAAGAAPSPLGTVTAVANDCPVFKLNGAAI